MPKKNFLLLSMEDTKIKKISNVISNDSCRKILDYLTEKEATETEIAQKLSIPISTVHYNLQQLTETGLITADEYHYSEKGKEVLHYKLANKYIIIAPKSTFGIKEKLKSILPVALIAAAGAGLIQFFSSFTSNSLSAASENLISVKDSAVQKSAPAASMMAQQQDNQVVSAAQAAPVQLAAHPNIALWFLYGALFALVVYFLISLYRKNKE